MYLTKGAKDEVLPSTPEIFFIFAFARLLFCRRARTSKRRVKKRKNKAINLGQARVVDWIAGFPPFWTSNIHCGTFADADADATRILFTADQNIFLSICQIYICSEIVCAVRGSQEQNISTSIGVQHIFVIICQIYVIYFARIARIICAVCRLLWQAGSKGDVRVPARTMRVSQPLGATYLYVELIVRMVKTFKWNLEVQLIY